MVTNLFSQTPAARDMGYCVCEALRKRVTFSQVGTAVTVGVLPARALVVGGGIFVTTAFNGTGMTANVGHADATAVPAAFASAISVAALGYIAFDELAAVTNTRSTGERTVTVTVTATAATTGDAEVIVLFVNDHEGNR
jgi:hypothetical protein